jgi:hypothetical protein
VRLEQLAAGWLAAKEAERVATDNRRSIEDDLIAALGVDENLDGTVVHHLPDDWLIKITGRMTRKVDGDRLQEIAAEMGLSHHLTSLFRWKPEVNMTAWKAADAYVVKPLSAAITTAPGRPSFTVTRKD